MEHVQQEIMVPLRDLVDSPLNVRRHSAASIDELAALIDSQGLQHALKVVEQPGRRAQSGWKARTRFGVVAGKRRRQALLHLAEQGKIDKDHAVRCDLVTEEQAREISVAENSGREPLHLADEFEAFKAMVDEGRSVEDVAARFGVEPLIVQRRLKLAALSPKLVALYREGGINLDQLMALTLTDDHAVQERAWFEARPWEREPSALRRVLTAGEVQAAGNALVRFVGIEAYEGAGGFVRRDLFDSQQAGWISDPELLRRIATEKLDGIAEAVQAEGWSWVEARIEFDGVALRRFSRCESTLRRLTHDESQALDEMKRRKAELDGEYQAMRESDDYSQAERIGLEEEDIAERRSRIRAARETWRAVDKARAGAVVTVSRAGDPEIVRGLVREADRRAAEAAQRQEVKAAAGDRPDGGAKAAEGDGEAVGTAAPADIPDSPKLSDALLRRLAAHRTLALQAALAANGHLALAALAHVLVKGLLSDGWHRERSAMQVTVQWPATALAVVADDLPTSRAAQVLEAAKQGWKEKLPESRGEWFGWLAALPQDDLLALCAALAVNALPGAGAVADADALARAAALDMADWWEPTAERYLDHVSKVRIVAAVEEAGGDPAASRALLLLNKHGLVAEAALRLAGKRWLPQPLRPSVPR